MIKSQISPGGCCTLELKTVHHNDHNYESSRKFLFCSAEVITHSELITRYMFGEATKHLFLKYLSYLTKTTQEESWVSETKESPEIKRTVGQRWEKNVCKHRRRRSLSSSLVLSSGCTVPKPVPRSLRAPLPTVQLNTRFTLHEIRKWRRGPAGEITPSTVKWWFIASL